MRNAYSEQSNPLPEWQETLFNQITHSLKRYYCLPKKLDNSNLWTELREAFIRIRSDQINFLKLTDEINKILQKFDPHLALQFAPNFIKDRIRDGHLLDGRFDFGSTPPDVLYQMNEYRGHPDRNYGFITTPKDGSVIPNDIGYLKIEVLLPPQDGGEKDANGEYILGPEYRLGPNAREAVNRAMQSMAGKKGIILDLRDSEEGGSPEMGQYIVSFFIRQKGMEINAIHDRFAGTKNIYKVLETPYNLFDIPVRILTDNTTFSGREEIAYDLQQINHVLQKTGQQIGNRFQIVGEITQGGAHPERSFPLVDSSGNLNKNIVIRIPYATALNPYTNTNWEDGLKKGVQPDVEILENQNALEIGVKSIQRAQHSLKFTSAASRSVGIFKDLKDHTRADPYGPGAIVLWRKTT